MAGRGQSEATGCGAHRTSAYFGIYYVLALVLVCSLAGLLCLSAIRRREKNLEAGSLEPGEYLHLEALK